MTARIASLFSGYGGTDMAAEDVFGGRVIWHAETGPAQSRMLHARWPGVPNLGDVRSLDFAACGPVDVLTASYPCTPFSIAGRRRGERDEQHLWPWVREAIRVLRPRYTVLENVAGHRTLGFARVLADLAHDGMCARWTSAWACDAGAPHLRERLFVLVTPDDADDGLEIREESVFARHQPGEDSWKMWPDAGLWGTVEHTKAWPRAGSMRSGLAWELPAPDLTRDQIPLLPTPVARPPGGSAENHLRKKPGRKKVTDLAMVVENELLSTGGKIPQNPTCRAHAKRTSRACILSPASRSAPSLEQAVEIGMGILPRELESWDEAPRSWQPWTDASAALCPVWGKYEPAVRRWETLTREAPHPTDTAPSGPRKGQQVLSPRFVEWMMGLPSGHVTGLPNVSRTKQLEALGNGVVPQQARLALAELLGLGPGVPLAPKGGRAA